jgi:hypothetical protein
LLWNLATLAEDKSSLDMAAQSHVALATGSRIGQCICLRLLDAGHDVVALQRTRPAIDHPPLRLFQVDLTDREPTAVSTRARSASPASPRR